MRKIRINLTTKFVILFLAISLIPLLIAIYVSYDSSRRVLEEETTYYFYGIIDNKTKRIESYFSDQKKEIATLVRIPTIIEATKKFNETREKNKTNSSAYQKIDDEIRPILSYFKESSNYHDLMLVAVDGYVLFSANGGKGEIFSEEGELKDLFNKSNTLWETEMSSFQYDQTDKKMYAYIIAPIIEEKNLIGFGIFKIDHQDVYEITQDYTGLGNTGETLLAARYGDNVIFVAPLRHDQEATFKKIISGPDEEEKEILMAMQGRRGWGITTDYRKERVLAAWSYLPAFQWGIAVKMDLSEVLAVADDLEKRLFVISLVLLIMIILVTFLTVRSVSGPVKKLTYVAAEISRGNFALRADVKSNDEIEDLGQSFDQMTNSLLKSQEKLKDKSRELEKNLRILHEEKQNAVQAKEKLDAILYGIGEGVFVVDQEGRINVFNREAQNISGFGAEEVVGKKYDHNLKFLVEDKNKKTSNIFWNFNPERIANFPAGALLMDKSGKKIPVQGGSAPLKDNFGELIGYAVVFRDVTKEREIDRAKTEFVSLASHQLRTPLSTINWYAEMLLDEEIGKINENQKKYLHSLYEASNRMVQLVNALLNVSRIELGTFAIDPEPIDFKEVADSVINEQIRQIEGKKLKLSREYDPNLPVVNADPKLLRIIFQNLLSNSVKYTPEQGKISIKIKKQDKNIMISIIDTGYGIPKNQQMRIFTKLFRADNVLEKDTDGSGLGLYVVKSIVEQAGGKIWFESEENKGTSFFVSIPASGMQKKRGNKVLAS